MTLSRAELKSQLFGEFGIKWFLSYDKTEARQKTSLAINSLHIVDEGIDAFLAGCNDEARQLFVMAKDWLNTAISEGEIPQQLGPGEAPRYTANFHEAQTFALLGLCCWLTDEGFAQPAFQTGAQFALDYCDQHPSDFSNSVFRYLVLGEKNAEIKQLFANCPKLSPPSTLRRIKSEEKIAYVVASHFLGGTINRDIVLSALRDFLRYKIPICAGANHRGLGLARDIPLWMHVYHSVVRADDLSAFEQLAKVFEFLEITQ